MIGKCGGILKKCALLVFSVFVFLGSFVGKLNAQDETPLRIGVAAMISPKETFNVYQQIVYYIGEKLGRSVELVQRETYAEMNTALENGEVDVAFVCAGPYVDGNKKFGLELLVAPKAYGEAVYYAYIIVRKDSPINSLEELRGKRFGFTDPNSNTGCLVPTYMVAKKGETPESFFSACSYTGHHSKSIKAVAAGEIDGASVDSLIYDYSAATDPEFTSMTKIIERSPPYGIPPVVVPPTIDPGLRRDLKKAFLGMGEDRYGKKILKQVMIEKFIVPNDSDYDSVREMKEWIENNK